MAENDQKAQPPKASGKAFFDRADEVAETGNWDFAIEMYLQGIQREPDNLTRGHEPLRKVSLKRKSQGGKSPGFRDQFKHRPTKDPLQNLLNAEYLLAKEPGSIPHMVQVLQAAKALELPAVAKWICDILLETQRQGKPNGKILRLLVQTYHDIEQYALAIQACDMARQLSPDDPQLQEALKELSAKYTIQKGRYGQEGDFTKGVADLDRQKALMEKDRMVQSKDYIAHRIEETRKDYLQTPTAAGKINAYVDALLKPEDESYENEAVDVLRKAYKDTGVYQFKMRIGEIRIKQMTRQYRKLVESGNKQAAAEHARKQLAYELKEFTERAENYPTDLAVKYELGRRQFLAGQYDEAIASLQQAQRDPRRHVTAMNYLGQAFARKQWFREAADTFRRALTVDMTETREKELRYSLGDVLEQMGELEPAQEEFSRVAQVDFNYKDVHQRLDGIRKKLLEGPGPAADGGKTS